MPFEFRWHTNADFKTIAADLGRAINFINRRSGKPVHVVAHSFGGVAVRALLQNLATDISGDINGSMATARAAVADLTSLGSPYSGIMEADSGVDLLSASVALPWGRDDGTQIGICRQISCQQMGESTGAITDLALALGYAPNDLRVGGIAAQLAMTAERLPAIPVFAGIGMRIREGRYTNGDHLIRFAGQRFVNPMTEARGNTNALLDNTLVGQAIVSEVVLGADRSARPGVVASAAMPSRRVGGYTHTSVLADDGDFFGYGRQAAVEADCSIPETCTHAGYLLFRQMMGHLLNLNNQAALSLETAAPVALILNPVRLRGRTAAEAAELAQLLADVKPYVSGPRVRWDRMPAATLARHNVTLSRIFGDSEVEPVIADYAARISAFNDFAERTLTSQNTLAVWDAQTVEALWSIAGAAAKGAFAAVKLMEPGARLVNSLGAKVRFADPLKYVETLQKLKQVSTSLEFAQLVGQCGSTTLLLMANALEVAGNDGVDGDVLQDVLLKVTNCIATSLSDDSMGSSQRFKLAMKLASASVVVDGKKVNTVVALTSAVSAVLDVMPPWPVVGFAQGAFDYVNAAATSWAAGQAIADHAGELVSFRLDQAQALINQLQAPLLADRSLQIMLVRSANLFVAVPGQWGQVAVVPSQPVVGEPSSWTVREAYETVTSVLWNFGSAAAEMVAQVVNGTAAVVSYVFNALGLAEVVVTFRDAMQTVLGTQSVPATVVAVSPRVHAMQPRAATAGQTTTFTVTGVALHAGLRFQTTACNGTELPGGSDTRREFSCTFPLTTAAGNYDGTVALTNSPFGAPPLYTFTVAVGRPSVGTVQPANTTRTLVTSLDITGQDLPTSGITVVPVGDSRSTCQVPNNLTATGFGVACELYKVGTQTLEVRQGSDVLGSVTVNVASNVTGVTWTSPSTTNSGTVKFGETVTFKVAGTNLLADTTMGFAVEKCGVSNTEVGVRSNTERTFRCLFNNEAGAVAGQMPGVVKDAPGGLVLLDGWRVPVEVPAVTPDGIIELPATHYVRGQNVALSANGYGFDTLMIAPPYTGADIAAEWDFSIATAGTYELFADFAAAESRPVVISFDGTVQFSSALSAVTGGWFPANRQLLSQGLVQLAAGAHTMRVARSPDFPHIKGFRLQQVSAANAWCGQSVTFAGNQLPASWQLAKVRSGPGVINERLEGRPTDSGAEVSSPYAAVNAGTQRVEAKLRINTAYSFWGQQMGVSYQLASGRVLLIGLSHARYNHGDGNLVMSVQDHNGSWGSPTATGTVLTQTKLPGYRHGLHEVSVTVQEGQMTMRVTNLDSPSVTDINFATGLPATFKLADIRKALFHVYTTTDGPIWGDDVSWKCLP